MCLALWSKRGHTIVIVVVLWWLSPACLSVALSSLQVSSRSGEPASWWPPASCWRHRAQRRAPLTHPPAPCRTPSPRPVPRTKHSQATRGRQRATSERPTVATFTHTHTHTHTHIHTHAHTHACLRCLDGSRGQSDEFPRDMLLSDRFTECQIDSLRSQ